MKSLIILEIEHGEDTTALGSMISEIQTVPGMMNSRVGHECVRLTDYAVRIDLDEAFATVPLNDLIPSFELRN